MTQFNRLRDDARLLVSVRDLDEALVAASSTHVGIVDLKEPLNGALGCVSFATARLICDRMPDEVTRSIALGEAANEAPWPCVSAQQKSELISRFQFAKVGLSGLRDHPNWVSVWRKRLELIPQQVCRVAVAYADSNAANSPSIDSIIENAAATECKAVLIDTFEKGQGGVLEILGLGSLNRIIDLARRQQLLVVLAGSLGIDDIESVAKLKPDFIGVRGAVCGDDRCSEVIPEKIEQLGKRLRLAHAKVSKIGSKS